MKNSIYSKVILLALFVVLIVQTASAQAANIAWTDWTNVVPDTINGVNTESGQIVNNNDIVNVRYNGVLAVFADGDDFYRNFPATYNSSSPKDLVGLWNQGSININFSKPVVDPYFAFVSIGRPDLQVDYKFLNLQNPLRYISHGPNHRGGSYLFTDDTFTLTNDTLEGREFNGLLQLPGIYTDISFEVTNSEFWNGFNIGVASEPTPVPEPTSMALGAMGIAGILGFRRRK